MNQGVAEDQLRFEQNQQQMEIAICITWMRAHATMQNVLAV